MDLLGEVGREEAGVVVVGCLGHLGGGGGVGRGIGSRGGLRKREEEEYEFRMRITKCAFNMG